MSMLAGTSQAGLLLAQLIMGAALAGVLLVAMVGELFPTVLRATGMAMTAGLATALVGGTAPAIDQILVTALNLDVAPGVCVSVVACLALLALWRWPETAFKPVIEQPGGLTLAPDLDQIDAGIPQGVNESPERGIV